MLDWTLWGSGVGEGNRERRLTAPFVGFSARPLLLVLGLIPPSLVPLSSMSLETIWLISQQGNSTICTGSHGSRESGR